jgi:hypothetical protein
MRERDKKKTPRINRDTLEEVYYLNSNRDACRILKITNPTLIKYLDFYNIKKKGRGKNAGFTKIILME